MIYIINCYTDFAGALNAAGFSLGGSNDEGIFSLSHQFSENIEWHTGDPDTDPWQWRMRILTEDTGISNAKIFFRKSGYITKEWYPCFLAVRRSGRTFLDEYESGEVSQFAKRIYELIDKNGSLAFHEIKQHGGFAKDDKYRFERALVELQMRMYITICGSAQKNNRTDGWASTVFSTTEQFFGEDVFKKASGYTREQAIEQITAQVYRLNPNAELRKIKRFIYG